VTKQNCLSLQRPPRRYLARRIFGAYGAIGELGRLDFLINKAGTLATHEPIPGRELERMTEGLWQSIVSANLLGSFRCIKFAAGALRAVKGAVVTTASIGGLGVVGSSIAYGASKARVINMTKNLACFDSRGPSQRDGAWIFGEWLDVAAPRWSRDRHRSLTAADVG
jgi:NAD(P)-dependent dehydrogenase (short-subunit alcohol dehydrogenase family)